MYVLKRDISLQTLFLTNPKKSNWEDGGADAVKHLLDKIFLSEDYELNPLLAQVFTHHSCYPESSSECNRKLAFLGDALLGKKS